MSKAWKPRPILTKNIKNIAKIGEAIETKGASGGPASKPVSEFQAVQQFVVFYGGRPKFRKWSEKLFNALAQR